MVTKITGSRLPKNQPEVVKYKVRSSEIKRLTFERDGCCQRCETKEDLICHHIVSYVEGGPDVDVLENTLTLCGTCHYGWHYKCEGWVSFELYMSQKTKVARTPHAQRTKDGLRAAKERGVKLGNPHGAIHLQPYSAKGAAISAERRRIKTKAFTESLRAAVEDMWDSGVTNQRVIAENLNAKGFRTPTGCMWERTNVRRLLMRMWGTQYEAILLYSQPDVAPVGS
jgi:hypothetical protein